MTLAITRLKTVHKCFGTLILACLLAGPSSASRDAEGLDARFIADASCGTETLITLRLKNRDSLPLNLGAPQITATELDLRPTPKQAPPAQEGQDDPEVLPVPPTPVQQRPSALEYLPEVLPKTLESQAVHQSMFNLRIPRENGFYRERVEVRWSYPAFADTVPGLESKAEAMLHYRVTDGCLQPLSVEKFHDLADPHQDLGAPAEDLETLDSVTGFSDTNAFERPESEAVTLVDSRFTTFWNDDPTSTGGEVIEGRYCLRIRYKDNFDNCPTSTMGMKWWRPYCDARQVPMLGLEVYLFDRDSSSMDDWIGTYALHYDDINHYACLEFTWDQDQRGELYPDIYAITNFDVHDTEFGAEEEIHLCRENQKSKEICDEKFSYDWRDSYEANVGSSSGTVYSSLNFGSKTNVWNRRAMSMSTVQKVLRGFQGQRLLSDLNVWWNGDQCTTSAGDPWPCSYDRDWFTLTTDDYRDWFTGPHEMGHNYQKHLFEQNNLYGKSCPSPHFLTVANNESCATREGWANFFSGLTWYTGPDAKNGGVPRYGSRPLETGVHGADCSERSQIEIQVARTFWDIYDNSTDGTDTSPGVTRFDILRTWDEFENGTANHKDKEGGANGGNLRDFKFNASWLSGLQSMIEDAMKQNDTDCQSDS